MVSCCVKTCRNTSGTKNLKNSTITYHYFPKDVKYKEKWIDAIGRVDWFPSKKSSVCSEHFESKFMKKKRHFLLPNAVPTLKLKSTESQHQQQAPINSQTRTYNPDDDTYETDDETLKDVSMSARDEASIFGEYIAAKIRQMDPIIASTVQRHIRNIIHQAEMGVYSQDGSIIKQESTVDESSCEDALDCGVKQESVEVELTALDGQTHIQDMSPLVGASGVNAKQGAPIKVEAEETDMNIESTVFQPVDSCFRINQQRTYLVKEGNTINGDGNDSNPRRRVEGECIKGRSEDSHQQSTSSNSRVENAVMPIQVETNVNTSTQQYDVVGTMKNLVNVELETGFTAVEHADSKYSQYKMGTNGNR